MSKRLQPIIRRWVIVLAAFGLAVVAISYAFVDVIPKSAITPSAIGETRARIGIYYSANHALPPNLAVLPIREDHINRTTDAWNRPLIYTIDAADSFTLSSFGRDGVPGGVGEDADIVRKFRIVGSEIEPVQ
jgi:Type II secretion system (T2SS), protein G